jgi:hypothetical protein
MFALSSDDGSGEPRWGSRREVELRVGGALARGELGGGAREELLRTPQTEHATCHSQEWERNKG